MSYFLEQLYSSPKWVVLSVVTTKDTHILLGCFTGTTVLYNCPGIAEVAMKNMGKIDICQITTQDNKARTVDMIWGIYIIYIWNYQHVWGLTIPTKVLLSHYDDVIMTMLASQITSLMVVYSIVYLGVNQRKHQSSASLAFVREIHRGPVNFPHKWPVTRKMFPLDDVIMSDGQPDRWICVALA